MDQGRGPPLAVDHATAYFPELPKRFKTTETFELRRGDMIHPFRLATHVWRVDVLEHDYIVDRIVLIDVGSAPCGGDGADGRFDGHGVRTSGIGSYDVVVRRRRQPYGTTALYGTYITELRLPRTGNVRE